MRTSDMERNLKTLLQLNGAAPAPRDFPIGASHMGAPIMGHKINIPAETQFNKSSAHGK